MNTEERTDYEKGPEYARVLREVLSVITAMQAPAEVDEAFAPEWEDEEIEVNAEQCFGTFGNYGITNIDGPDVSRPVVVEWPDLAWAKDQIVKVLGS